MNYVTYEKSNIKASVIALGTWAFGGGDYWANIKNDKKSFDTIDAALDLGINFFDTAESYNDGQSELLLGKAMKNRREKFVVSTKAYLDKLSKDALVKTCEDSLRRLDTDYVDFFLPHFASKEIPFEETFSTLLKLKEQGKIRAISLSNFGVESLKQLQKLGMLDQIDFNQLPYSLLWRAIEYDIQQETTLHNIQIICYSTLAQGLLTGKYHSAAEVPDNFKVLRLFHSESNPGAEQEVFDSIKELELLCKEANLDLAPAALAWLLRQPGVSNLLTGADSPDALRENLTCLTINLPTEIAQKMSQITNKVKEKLGDNADMWASGADSRIF